MRQWTKIKHSNVLKLTDGRDNTIHFLKSKGLSCGHLYFMVRYSACSI